MIGIIIIIVMITLGIIIIMIIVKLSKLHFLKTCNCLDKPFMEHNEHVHLWIFHSYLNWIVVISNYFWSNIYIYIYFFTIVFSYCEHRELHSQLWSLYLVSQWFSNCGVGPHKERRAPKQINYIYFLNLSWSKYNECWMFKQIP